MTLTEKSKLIPITCTASHFVDVRILKSLQGSLKSRTREQISKLRNLILKQGFSFPIYLWLSNSTYHTLDGHGRDYICKDLVEDGYKFKHKNGDVNTKLPVIFVDAKNRREAKEKLLSVNGRFGDITEEGLVSFLTEQKCELNLSEIKEYLELPNIDLNLLDRKLRFGDEGKEADREYQFIFTQSQLKENIKNNFPTFNSTEEIINGIIDKPLAMHQFNKLCSGNKNVGSEISLLFNPHRLETKINNRKLSAAEAFISKEKGLLSSLAQWMSKQREVVHHSKYIIEAKFGTGTQIAHEFKPFLARDIYLDYCSENTKVLDPCAGWGGRMIGFVSSLLGGEYVATDPATKTFAGLNNLKEFLLNANLGNEPQINLHNLPFEDFGINEEYFDFAFTSPPYFDTEIYSDEVTQAFNRHPTIEAFNEKFLTILIKNTLKALKPGGKFLLNIGGSQYRFDLVVQQICENNGFKVREIFKYKIGKGDFIIQGYKGDKFENSIKANDLFFEISKNKYGN